MSRAFVNEQDADALDVLPDRPISPHPNDVTQQGMKQLEAMTPTANVDIIAKREGCSPGKVNMTISLASCASKA